MERPREKGHGDYATNVALQLAKKAGTNPRAFGELLAASCAQADGDRGGRGRRARVPQHHRRGRRPGRGRGRDRRGRRGVRRATTARPARRSTSSSSPPTRPARSTSATPAGRPSATRIGRVLEAAGAEVTREFYINDRGAQMDLFGASIEARGAGRAGARGRLPAATTSPSSPPRSWPSAPEHRRPARRRGAARSRSARRRTRCSSTEQQDAARRASGRRLRRLVLRAEPARRAAPSSARIERLREHGPHLRGGRRAVAAHRPTSATTRTGCSIRSNGELTYFAGDTAYYVNKRERGFDRCIIPARRRPPRLRRPADGDVRVRPATTPTRNLEILIGQMVKTCSRTARRCGCPSGPATIVTLDDLVDAIGVDAAALRAGPLPDRLPARPRPRPWSPGRPTTTPSTTCSTRHARTCRMLAQRRRPRDVAARATSTRRCSPTSRRASCCARSAEFPRVVASAAELREPHRVARYLEDTAAVFNKWYDTGVPDAAAGRRAGAAGQRGAAGAGRRDPHRAAPTASACSASPPRSGCSGRADLPRGRLGARRPAPSRARLAARSPTTPTPWSRTCGRRPPTRSTACCTSAGVAVPDLVAEVNTPAYVLDEADFRARARAFRDAFAAYDVYYAGKAFLCTDGRAAGSPRRGSASTSAPAAS